MTDVVVEFADGRIANVEVQKIGYYFPGERTACYVSDLMLRQYRRIRSEKRKKFSYKDIREVYTIIFYESSPQEFRQFPDIYVHHGQHCFDSGIPFHIPMQIYMIPLDIFRESFYNKGMHTLLEAWLGFLSFDKPDEIIRLIREYPKFKAIYQHVYNICENVERMVTMFSKELAIADRNTAQLMIDDLMGKVKEQEAVIEAKDTIIEEKDTIIEEKEASIAEKDTIIEEKEASIAEKDSVIAEKNAAIAEKDIILAAKEASIEELIRKMDEMAEKLNALQRKISEDK